jgi:hypothetical protein
MTRALLLALTTGAIIGATLNHWFTNQLRTALQTGPQP